MREGYFISKKRYPKITGKEAEIFVSLFNDDDLKIFVFWHYLKGLTLEECAEKMHYSKRQIERMSTLMKDIAIQKMLKLLASEPDEYKTKFLKIANVINGDFLKEEFYV